jgi:xylose isomerase
VPRSGRGSFWGTANLLAHPRFLIAAAKLADDGTLARMTAERYAGWEGDLGRAISHATATLAELADRLESGEISPDPISGMLRRPAAVPSRILFQATSSR